MTTDAQTSRREARLVGARAALFLAPSAGGGAGHSTGRTIRFVRGKS